jgi:hypothetical protein
VAENLSSRRYAALMCAAQRLGFSLDDFECAMCKLGDKDGLDGTPQRWREMRAQLDREVDSLDASQGGRSDAEGAG